MLARLNKRKPDSSPKYIPAQIDRASVTGMGYTTGGATIGTTLGIASGTLLGGPIGGLFAGVLGSVTGGVGGLMAGRFMGGHYDLIAYRKRKKEAKQFLLEKSQEDKIFAKVSDDLAKLDILIKQYIEANYKQAGTSIVHNKMAMLQLYKNIKKLNWLVEDGILTHSQAKLIEGALCVYVANEIGDQKLFDQARLLYTQMIEDYKDELRKEFKAQEDTKKQLEESNKSEEENEQQLNKNLTESQQPASEDSENDIEESLEDIKADKKHQQHPLIYPGYFQSHQKTMSTKKDLSEDPLETIGKYFVYKTTDWIDKHYKGQKIGATREYELDDLKKLLKLERRIYEIQESILDNKRKLQKLELSQEQKTDLAQDIEAAKLTKKQLVKQYQVMLTSQQYNITTDSDRDRGSESDSEGKETKHFALWKQKSRGKKKTITDHEENEKEMEIRDLKGKQKNK